MANSSIYEELMKHKGKPIDGIVVSDLSINKPTVVDISHSLLTLEYKKGKQTKTAYVDLNSCSVRVFTVKKNRKLLWLINENVCHIFNNEIGNV